MKRIIFILLAYSCISFCYSQEDIRTQNFKKEISNIWFNSEIEPDHEKSINLLLKAKEIAKTNNKDSLFVKSIKLLGLRGIEKKDSLIYSSALKDLFNTYKLDENKDALGEYYCLKGSVYFKQKNMLDSAFLFYKKAQKVFLKNKLNKKAGETYKYIFPIQERFKDIIGLNFTANEAISFLEKNKDYNSLVNVYAYLGSNETDFNNKSSKPLNHKKSREFYEKALSYNKKVKNKYLQEKNFIAVYIRYSYTLINGNKFKEALVYGNKALTLINKSKYKSRKKQKLVSLLHNIAVCEISLGKKTIGLKRLKESLLKCGTNFTYNKAAILQDLAYAEVYFNKNTKKGIIYAKEALALSRKIKNNETILRSLKLLSDNTEGVLSKNYFKEQDLLKDSLFALQLKSKEKFFAIRDQLNEVKRDNEKLKNLNSEQNFFLTNELTKSRWFIVFTLLVLFILLFILRKFIKKQKLDRYKHNLEKASIKDNLSKEISKKLHDEVAGDLNALYQVTLNKDIKEISKPLQKVSSVIRNISHQLNSNNFDKINFKDQIVNLVSDYFQPDFKIEVKGIDNLNWKNVNEVIKRTLYLVIRESLQNSKKHALASKVEIKFNVVNNKLTLKITDNGKGFDINSPKYGIGLKNQKERIEELNGFFNIESILNTGTTTIINLPIRL